MFHVILHSHVQYISNVSDYILIVNRLHLYITIVINKLLIMFQIPKWTSIFHVALYVIMSKFTLLNHFKLFIYLFWQNTFPCSLVVDLGLVLKLYLSSSCCCLCSLWLILCLIFFSWYMCNCHLCSTSLCVLYWCYTDSKLFNNNCTKLSFFST